MDKLINLLVVGDGVAPTGFARVLHSILKNLPREEYEIHHLAVNYHGDPHDFNWKIYPASLGGDIYGLGRIGQFVNNPFDLVFILNDVWLIDTYLEFIKKATSTPPKIVTYFPVDAMKFDSDWFRHFDIVNQTVVYTQFGYDVVKEAMPDLDVKIIPHGTDSNVFFKIPADKNYLKSIFFPQKDEFKDSFIVLNANRNQPRKRIDISLEGFKLFSEGKPDSVKYFHHAGISDVGWNAVKLSRWMGIERRLIFNSLEQGIQRVPEDRLNMIYNCTDVGLNTSLGEGWGLTNTEHASVGVPQVVPDHSACRELFKDVGLLIPTYQNSYLEKVNTQGRLVRAEDVAEQLEKLYVDKELREELGKKGLEKFTAPELQWKNVAKQWDELFKRVVYGH